MEGQKKDTSRQPNLEQEVSDSSLKEENKLEEPQKAPKRGRGKGKGKGKEL